MDTPKLVYDVDLFVYGCEPGLCRDKLSPVIVMHPTYGGIGDGLWVWGGLVEGSLVCVTAFQN